MSATRPHLLAIAHVLAGWCSLLLLLAIPSLNAAESLSVDDDQGHEIEVEIRPAEGDLLVIWLADHDEEWPLLGEMLGMHAAAGIEVWRVDLVRDYFLPQGSETWRTLDGKGVAALIEAALHHSRKRILLATYDRASLPLLRGLRLWQGRQAGNPVPARLAGAVLFHPNLFGPPPPAGEAPELDPILNATNYPLVLVQPQFGSQRWRIGEVMRSLWQAGSPAHLLRQDGVRDWYFMDDPGNPAGPAERQATAQVPGLLRQAARLLEGSPRPTAPVDMAEAALAVRAALPRNPLWRLAKPRPAPTLALMDLDGRRIQLKDYRGQVVLINFWATWCPPCVEEIPSLNRLGERYRDRPLALLSVDFQEPAEKIRDFARRVPVGFPVMLDRDGRASLDWQVFSFPSSFVIDRQGRIRFALNKAIDWDTEEIHRLIEGLLDES